MKIRIIDWKLFEKSNGIYFTRDINIVNDYNVYAMEIGKKHNKLLVYMDFISFKYLGFIEYNESISIIDNNISNNWVYKKNLVLNIYANGLYFQKYSYENILAPEWMIQGSFLVDLRENPVKAENEFLDHMK